MPDINLDQTFELQQQIVRLQALLEASRRIHSTIQLDEVLRCALEIVVRELEMEGAYFWGFPFSVGRIPPRLLLTLNSSGSHTRLFPLPADRQGGCEAH